MIKGQKALLLSGQDVFLPECNIVISQPKIKDIAVFGEDSFLTASQLLGKPEMFLRPIRSQGDSMLAEASDFQIIMIMIQQQPDLRAGIEVFFELITPKYNVKIEDAAINFYIDESAVGQIQPFNFQAFQEAIKEMFIPVIKGQQEEIEYNPATDKAKEIAEKIRKGRAKVAQLNAKPGDENASLFARFISTLSVGMAMDMNIFYNYTPYQLYDTFNRYMLKMKSDFYMKVSTTPLMDTSKMEEPEDWMGNL